MFLKYLNNATENSSMVSKIFCIFICIYTEKIYQKEAHGEALPSEDRHLFEMS